MLRTSSLKRIVEQPHVSRVDCQTITPAPKAASCRRYPEVAKDSGQHIDPVVHGTTGEHHQDRNGSLAIKRRNIVGRARCGGQVVRASFMFLRSPRLYSSANAHHQRISGPYRFFFYSFDCDEPRHVHVSRDTKICKFWLYPLELAQDDGFATIELNRIRR
jgi:hypothetical protein